jgi:hypothetical protein
MSDAFDERIGPRFQQACALQGHLPALDPYETAAQIEAQLDLLDEAQLAVAGAALAWVHAGMEIPLLLLETAAMVGLHDDGASGDIEGWADDLRHILQVMSLWLEALEERVSDEEELEAVEDAAVSLGRTPSRLDEEDDLSEFEMARDRVRDRRDRQDALRRRIEVIDRARLERSRRIEAHIRELAGETSGPAN